MSNPSKATVELSWKALESSGLYPSTRYGGKSFVYQDYIWLVCGSGAGIGKTSEIWKYSLIEYKWTLVQAKGDIPCSRDGHSISYIDGEILLFGGQGYSSPNLKYHKQLDKSRSLCLGIREIYNDVCTFNFQKEEWTSVTVCGTFFPAGRRGHSSVYIGHIHSSSKTDVLIPNNSVIIFGGAGFEIGKNSEQIYNDTWIYSITLNKWDRVFPRGETPRACYDHCAELVGEHMIVVGGILGSQRNSLNPIDHSTSPSNILLLNILTLTFSYVQINGINGHPAHLNIHAFSMSRSSRSNPNKLIIFGGKECSDLKRASEYKQYTQHHYSLYTWELDLKQGIFAAIPCITPTEESPENRCGHIGVSSIPIDELLHLHKRLFKKDHDHPATSAPSNSVSASSSRPNTGSQAFMGRLKLSVHSDGLPLFYIYGGSRVGGSLRDGSSGIGGYCDPILYQLVAIPKNQVIRSPVNNYRNPLGWRNSKLKREKNSNSGQQQHYSGQPMSPLFSPSNFFPSLIMSSKASPRTHVASPRGIHKIQAKLEAQETVEPSDSDDDTEHVLGHIGISPEKHGHHHHGNMVSASNSLWESKLIQSGKSFRNPKEWSELKLALMQPVSQRNLISAHSHRKKQASYASNRASNTLNTDSYSASVQNSYISINGENSIDSNSVFSANDMQEFYRTGLLLEHSQELSMIPIDYNPREYMKLPLSQRNHVIAENIVTKLGSKFKGKTFANAKKEYFKVFPPPSYEKSMTQSRSLFTSTASSILDRK